MAKISVNEHNIPTFKYSEIFASLQGEGAHTGKATAWIRFFLCNLTCDGFGQTDPTDPSTYVLPYKDLDIIDVKSIEELPVFSYGCDSSYTWAKKYRHLAKDQTAIEICDAIQEVYKHPSNPEGLFSHPASGQDIHMAFTGGEPMLNQPAIVRILEEFEKRNNFPKMVTVETNGTKPFKKKAGLDEYIFHEYIEDHEWFWSCSPKLFSTSGEKEKKAIKPEVVASYAEVSDRGQLKYVVDGSDLSWSEVERHTNAFREAGVNWDVYIMPVGATKESQEESRIAEIAVEAIKRGYNVSGRLHCYIFGNKIGT